MPLHQDRKKRSRINGWNMEYAYFQFYKKSEENQGFLLRGIFVVSTTHIFYSIYYLAAGNCNFIHFYHEIQII